MLVRWTGYDPERVLPSGLSFDPDIQREQSVGSGLRSWEHCQVMLYISKTNDDTNRTIWWSRTAQQRKKRLDTYRQ